MAKNITKKSIMGQWAALLGIICVCLLGCKGKAGKVGNQADARKAGKRAKATSRPTSRPVRRAALWAFARPKAKWVDKRVAAARARLGKSAAGKIVWASIEASGGLKRWFTNGPLRYRFRYAPVNQKRIRDSHQTIDTWSARARHIHVAKPKWSFGWDGKQAWYHPKGVKQPINARFWSLTPFFFVGIPFVLADPGVVLKKLKSTRLEGKKYELVHVSFQAGTGDAPKDYYIVYINAKTKRVGGVRYVVSYPGFFPKGGHSPEKLMTYDGSQTVNGIHFPKTFRTFKWNKKRKKRIKVVTRSKMQDVSFAKDTPASFFAVPKDGTVQKGYR